MEQSKTTKGKILRGGLSAAVLILTAALCAYLQWERAPTPTGAPERAEVLAVNRVLPEVTTEPQPTETAPVSARRDGVYTLLLAGQDDGNANTDTLMVARLDSGEHRIDVVSIPRDTMINTAWKIRKINAAYAMGPYNNESGAASLSRQIARLTGFEPDCYAILDLDAFRQVIDVMGGVRFEVPMAMDYEDRSQGLSIHLRPGEQLLNGQQAMGLCRYRSGYSNADLGRIEMQQRFLKSCADQFISLGNIPNLPKVVQILAEHLETNVSAGNIAWLLRQTLQCKSEDIHFSTAPTALDTVDGYRYTILELEPWLALVNASLNPYRETIRAEDLDLIYRRDGGIACTAVMANKAETLQTTMAEESIRSAGPRVSVVELPKP